MPEPPVQPDLDACCGDGCNPCIFDLYDAAMEQHRQALRAWHARHSQTASVVERERGKPGGETR